MRTRVLFVCMGNICRSPTAEGVFRKLVEGEGLLAGFSIDSAGTINYHEGEPPDRRAQAAARRRGVDLSRLVARAVTTDDFESFDVILAMDRDNLAALTARCPAQHRGKLRLFLDGMELDEVPDPYYGGPDGFEQVLDLCEAGARRLLDELRR